MSSTPRLPGAHSATWVRAAHKLRQNCRKSTDFIAEKEVDSISLQSRMSRNSARPTTSIALCGINFFFEDRLGQTMDQLLRADPAGSSEEGAAEEQLRQCEVFALRMMTGLLLKQKSKEAATIQIQVMRLQLPRVLQTQDIHLLLAWRQCWRPDDAAHERAKNALREVRF